MSASKDRSWPAYSLFIACGFAIAYVVGGVLASAYQQTEVMHRTAGGILQLLGVVTVASGISQLRRRFGLQYTIAEMISEWGVYLKEVWWSIAQFFGKKRDVTVAVGTAHITAGAASVRGHATVSAGPNASVEERLRMLERQYAQLSKLIFDLESKLQEEEKKRADAVKAEGQARKSALEDMQHTIVGLATGGIRLQIVGVIWFLAGISVATWAQEIATW